MEVYGFAWDGLLCPRLHLPSYLPLFAASLEGPKENRVERSANGCGKHERPFRIR